MLCGGKYYFFLGPLHFGNGSYTLKAPQYKPGSYVQYMGDSRGDVGGEARSYGKYIEEKLGRKECAWEYQPSPGTAGRPGLYYGHSTNLSKESHKESIMF